jgi:predicted peptidase
MYSLKPIFFFIFRLDMIWKSVSGRFCSSFMVRLYKVDTNRLYVTGISMGGTGTWDLAIAYPRRFAAIIPICGRTKPEEAGRIKDLPIWVFHGEKDDIRLPEESQNMVNALRALGSPVKFTLYPEADHDAWTETYNNPDLWKWLMEQRKQ